MKQAFLLVKLDTSSRDETLDLTDQILVHKARAGLNDSWRVVAVQEVSYDTEGRFILILEPNSLWNGETLDGKEPLATKKKAHGQGVVPFGYRLADDGIHLEEDAAEQAALAIFHKLREVLRRADAAAAAATDPVATPAALFRNRCDRSRPEDPGEFLTPKRHAQSYR